MAGKNVFKLNVISQKAFFNFLWKQGENFNPHTDGSVTFHEQRIGVKNFIRNLEAWSFKHSSIFTGSDISKPDSKGSRSGLFNLSMIRKTRKWEIPRDFQNPIWRGWVFGLSRNPENHSSFEGDQKLDQPKAQKYILMKRL